MLNEGVLLFFVPPLDLLKLSVFNNSNKNNKNPFCYHNQSYTALFLFLILIKPHWSTGHKTLTYLLFLFYFCYSPSVLLCCRIL